MPPDSDLLFARLKADPTDETLMAALADACVEEGRGEMADAVLALRQAQAAVRRDGSMRYERDRWLYKMGLREVEVHDYLFYEPDGRVFPISGRMGAVAIAQSRADADGLLRAYLLGDWGSYFRHCMLQMVKRIGA